MSQINSSKHFKINTEAQPAFKINTERGIPDGSSIRSNADSRAALDNLVRLPPHKQGTIKFDASKMQRTLSPLTFEDTGQFNNLGLISTLRTSKVAKKNFQIKTQTSVDQNADEASQADNNLTTTIPVPPSFYEDDMEKKFKKYEPALRER